MKLSTPVEILVDIESHLNFFPKHTVSQQFILDYNLHSSYL